MVVPILSLSCSIFLQPQYILPRAERTNFLLGYALPPRALFTVDYFHLLIKILFRALTQVTLTEEEGSVQLTSSLR